ncbi:hypothetical protein O1L60_37400 [Streptomyces diastatochromogenes]|nr:hypothetical protein [Streptomyces diastatochromogenes]
MSGYGQGLGPGHAYGDEERTFEALPPAQGGAFTRTWWGRAWLKALEDSALDGQQLKAGRRHARAGPWAPSRCGPAGSPRWSRTATGRRTAATCW